MAPHNIPLSQWSESEATDSLRESLEEFNKVAAKQTAQLIGLTRVLVVLTVLLFLGLLVQIGVALTPSVSAPAAAIESPTHSSAATPSTTHTPSATATRPPLLAGSWAQLAPMPTTGSRVADATLGPGGRIYVWLVDVSGFTVPDEPVSVYDPQTDAWSLEAPTAVPGPRLFGGETATYWGYGDETEVAAGGDGLIYASEGVAGPEFYLHAYDPVTRAWGPEPALQFDTFVFDLAAGPDGRIYLLGGVSGSGSRIRVFDPQGATLSEGGSLQDWLTQLVPAGDGTLLGYDQFQGAAATYDTSTQAWGEGWALEGSSVVDYSTVAADAQGWTYALSTKSDRPTTTVAFGPDHRLVEMPALPSSLDGTELLVGADGRLFVFGGPSGAVVAFTRDE